MKRTRTISAGGVVINRRGKVLVVNQRGNSWSLPKGHLDRDETLLDAAIREIHEESGVWKLDLVHYLGSYERFRIGKQGGEDTTEAKELHFFLFASNQRKHTPLHVDDHPEVRWLDIREAERLLTHPRDREFLSTQRPHIQSWSRSFYGTVSHAR